MTQIPKEQVVYCEQCMVPLHVRCANHCTSCGKILCDSCYADNDFMCEDCHTPEEDFTTIRRSYLEQYSGCPYSLMLQLVKGITPPMGSHAQLGVIVHELIDKISKDEKVTQTAAHSELEDRIIEWNLETDDEYSIITDELQSIGHICLDNFWLIKDQFISDFVAEHQIKFSLDEDLPMVSCTLDRISFVGDDIIINDWKTGKPMSGKKLTTDLQAPLYIYAVYSEYGKMPKSFNLHYLHPNKTISFVKTGDMEYTVKTTRSEYKLDVEEALERTKRILKNIKNKHFPMVEGKDQWRCSTLCWFGKNGKCSGGLQEQWKAVNESYAA